MKIKVIILLFLGMMSSFAQNAKKPVGTKKTVATTPVKKATPAPSNEGIFAEIETARGKIVVQLEYKKTPITVANFVSLAEGNNSFVTDSKLKGKPFYDGLKFHRVITKYNGDQQDFMIQGGDPQGNGSGGPGYAFKDEISDDKFDKAGVLAMANSGPNTNGSQFFITVTETSFLNGNYAIFGHVVKGQEVVNTIKKDDVMIKVTITRKGNEAKKFDAVKVFSDYYANRAEDERKTAEKEAKERIAANEIALKEFVSGQTTASGIKYIVIKEGIGNMPTATSNVKVHYTGTFTNGKVFDSSVQRGEPIDFPLNQVIPGWTEAVQLMKEGSKYKFYIPYILAYGERGMGPIPPKSDLIFEVELLKIN